MTFGVPFDRGTVTTATPLRLMADGTGLPSDTWPLAYWPDGSVKWAAIASTIPAGAGDLSVSIGKADKKKKRPTRPFWPQRHPHRLCSTMAV